MRARLAVFVVVLVVLFVATGFVFWRSWRLRRKDGSEDILELIAKLTPLDEARLREATNSFDDEGVDSPSKVLEHLGSWDVLLGNCEILAEVAEKIQVTYPEALLLAEELHRTARSIAWHLDRLGVLANGGSEDWLKHYGDTVLRLYLDSVDGFLLGCEAFSVTLSGALRERVWS